MFIPAAREALIQFLWSYYLLWQFWFLARGKTLTWTGTARFFAMGAWVIAPLSTIAVYLFHGVFAEGSVSVGARWSVEIVGPIMEESFKLIPFLLLFLFTNRTKSFSLTDYMLGGASVGVGFDFSEEVLRRWVTADQEGSLWGLFASLFSDNVQNREVFTLIPGYFSDGIAMSPGHGVWTGFITLGIGMALHVRNRWGKKAYLIPLFFFVWATFDHGAWNAHSFGMPAMAS
ncbi:PrsW family intramembrane metalloprotease [Mechercharimyces sp. CAU 1602]|uniref:PrsW family intramembrane metalloprotease n=1 Tax=Mechercharimyces sp. CAU 1602 TaxID=2973933 RepID=UPI0021626D4A|nr:PrsW family intramembrane metalloprotease [Mechercharimyces sp. CAU 1602]